MEYPYFFVTRGRSPDTQNFQNKMLPLALVPKTEGLRAVASKVEENIKRSALAFAPHAPTPMEILEGMTARRTVSTLLDLWLSEVRLTTALTLEQDDEEAIRWVLIGDQRLPDRWQGPADLVIPPTKPVTIRKRGVVAKFEVELTFT